MLLVIVTNIYYQQKAHKACVCQINIHYLLHDVGNVIASGPLYILWLFAMKLFNGLLEAKTHSQSQVNQNLSINIL